MNAGFWTSAIIIFALLVDFVFRVIAVIVVPRNRTPTSATAWLLAINFIPYIGLLVFLVIGSYKLPKHRRDKQERINQFILDSTEGTGRVRRDHPWPPWLDQVVMLNRSLGAMPMVGGNSAEFITEYEQSFTEMITQIDRAHTFVHVEFYILTLDTLTVPFFDALERAVTRGVTVRVLLDHIASLRTRGYRGAIKRLTTMGAQWQLMLPIQPWRRRYQRPDLRNHRKLLVVDGEVGFMGSQNIIDPGYDKRKNARRHLRWKELVVRLDGPVVAGLNAIFITDWYAETDELLAREDRQPEPVFHAPPREEIDCQLVPSGPGFPHENNLRLFLALLYYAQKRIIITSPYFVPDESIMAALLTALERGVTVELFVSEVADQWLVYHAQRSYYEQLLEAGVIIWMYRAPVILHAKHFTVDDEISVVGSSNMDIRSFQLNSEISMMVRSRHFNAELTEIQQGYRENSRRLTREEWARQPLRSTIADNLARLTSALQ